MSTTWVYRIGFGLLIAALLYVFFPNSEPNPRPDMWAIQVQQDKLSFLGLALHHSRLSDVLARLKVMPDVAMFTKRQRPNEAEPAMHLEAYFEDVFDEDDRVIVRLEADDKLLRRIKKEAYHPELFPNDVIRVAVREDLIPQINLLQIKNITLIAGERLKFEVFKAQFGDPDELIDDGEGNAHFLYANMGLDFIQPADGLQILQFVDPTQFESQLRAPLMLKQRQP